MNKKLFIFAILFLIITASLVWFFLFYKEPIGEELPIPGGLFPSGNETSTTSPKGGEEKPTSTDNKTLRLRQIHKEPVAGATVFSGSKGTTARFVERATGHIYEISIDDSSSVRLSNTTIPKVYEAFWSTAGDELLMRYLRDDNNTIRTFYTKLNDAIVENESLEGLFLDDNLNHISVFGNRFFYFQKSGTDTQGIIANLDGTKKTAVFTSGFGKFVPSWTSLNVVLLYTAPNAGTPGTAYTVNTVNGVYKKIATNTNGLTGLLDGVGYLALIGSGGSGLGLSIVNTETLATKALSISTMPEKCVWATNDPVVYCAVPKSIPTATYPDSWYQGAVSFSDRVWKIDTGTYETELVFDPSSESVGELDMINLRLDSEEKVLLFMNKKDLSLWAYQLKI